MSRDFEDSIRVMNLREEGWWDWHGTPPPKPKRQCPWERCGTVLTGSNSGPFCIHHTNALLAAIQHFRPLPSRFASLYLYGLGNQRGLKKWVEEMKRKKRDQSLYAMVKIFVANYRVRLAD